MSGSSATLALIFDFDDTLVPDSTTKLLKEHGINTDNFWEKDAKALVSSGYEPAHAYLKLLLDNIGVGKPLGPLTNEALREFGKTLDSQLYTGLHSLLRDVKRTVKDHKNIDIEFYIISGGLEEVIKGCEFAKNNFSSVYGCQLAGDSEGGTLRHIKRCITFTEKTRYLFEINKGINQSETIGKPYLVNKDVPPNERRILFKNMIYIGDGLTDIPCFSLVKKEGGTRFGVFNPAEERSAKRALTEFLKTDRVESMHAPKYGKRSELGALIRAAVGERCASIRIEPKEPY